VLSSRLLPPPVDTDIALYLHNCTSQHEHSYSKYALADCSLIFSVLSNYDRSCVYSNNTVGTAAHCFTHVILQDMDLSILLVPSDSKNSPVFLHTDFMHSKKNQFFWQYKKIKANIITVNFLTTESFSKVSYVCRINRYKNIHVDDIPNPDPTKFCKYAHLLPNTIPIQFISIQTVLMQLNLYR